MVLMGVWAYFFISETKKRNLEEMDALFGGVEVDEEKVGKVREGESGRCA